MQDDIGDPALGMVAEERAVHQGEPEAPAAEDREPHPPTTFNARRGCRAATDRTVPLYVTGAGTGLPRG